MEKCYCLSFNPSITIRAESTNRIELAMLNPESNANNLINTSNYENGVIMVGQIINFYFLIESRENCEKSTKYKNRLEVKL